MVKATAFHAVHNDTSSQGQCQGITSGVIVLSVHSNLSSMPSGFLTYLSFLDQPSHKNDNLSPIKNDHLIQHGN